MTVQPTAIIRLVTEWTLAQISRLLGEPQHRLIYLCEKGAVIPDFGDASGRGSSRLFSDRNVLEFALALRLRKLSMPVALSAAIVHVLRRFAEGVRRQRPGFDVVQSLRGPRALDLRILIRDGELLFFSLAGPSQPARLFGGLDFEKLLKRRPSTSSGRIAEVRRSKPSTPRGLEGLEGSAEARLEISVTEIARGLRLQS